MKITILLTRINTIRELFPFTLSFAPSSSVNEGSRALLTEQRWAFLGLGFTIENRTEGADCCPYLSEENIDPKWKKDVIEAGALVNKGPE
jgi:hypothetical protein